MQENVNFNPLCVWTYLFGQLRDTRSRAVINAQDYRSTFFRGNWTANKRGTQILSMSSILKSCKTKE